MRSLETIAREIVRDWKKIDYAAAPYVGAMLQMSSVDDKYIVEEGREIVLRFLCNASTWRGEVARRVKAELKAMTKLP